MGNSTGNADKNLQKQAQMIKRRKNAGTCWSKKEKVTQEKVTIQPKNKPKSTGERRKIKKISTKR